MTTVAETRTAQPVHQLLNDLIGAFWSASIQHQTHLASINALGLSALASQMQAHISDEPLTLKTLTDRLLDIGGVPAFVIAQPDIAYTLREMLDADLQAQEAGLPVLNRAIDIAAEQHDATTRRMIEDVLAGEENHLSWLRNELSLLDRMGEALYLSLRVASTAQA